MATLDGLVQEIVAIVPEVRGIQETVKEWIRRAVRRIDRIAVWRWLVETVEGEFSGGEKELVVADMIRPLEFIVDGRPLIRVEGEDVLFGVLWLQNVSDAVFFSWSGDRVLWRPEVEMEAGRKWRLVYQKESGDVDAGENWWLNNRPDLVKAKVLIECGLYLKSPELVAAFRDEFGSLLEEVRGGM